MSISFADIVQAGVGVIALFILYSFIQNTSKDNERRDKSDQQFMLLFATLSGKQESNTASIIKSGVDSEARQTAQTTTSEVAIKARVQTVGDANIVRLDKIDKALQLIQTTVSLYGDPAAEAKYDRALAILTAKLEDMAADIKDIHADVASNTEVGAANTTAITNAADALAASTPPTPPDAPVPAPVVVADISPQAVASIMDAVSKPDAGDSELKESV